MATTEHGTVREKPKLAVLLVFTEAGWLNYIIVYPKKMLTIGTMTVDDWIVAFVSFCLCVYCLLLTSTCHFGYPACSCNAVLLGAQLR